MARDAMTPGEPRRLGVLNYLDDLLKFKQFGRTCRSATTDAGVRNSTPLPLTSRSLIGHSLVLQLLRNVPDPWYLFSSNSQLTRRARPPLNTLSSPCWSASQSS